MVQGTSAERLLKAINDGVIFLDPAPKFVPGDASKTKRRSQWRVNDITSAINALYEKVESRTLASAACLMLVTAGGKAGRK